jgi:hypothetical protein
MTKPEIPFVEFPKISRYNREIVITEKIDGTNAQVYINDTGDRAFAGSRTRWIEPGDDNFGFAAWVKKNEDSLLNLGPGSHFGEWWGGSIQRGYGVSEKRFSLFNVGRWSDGDGGTRAPACCHVVPTLAKGNHLDLDIFDIMERLSINGSSAAPGFMKPEGIVIFHTHSSSLFKMTLDKNDAAKGNP